MGKTFSRKGIWTVTLQAEPFLTVHMAIPRIQFQIDNTCSKYNISWDNKVLTSDPARQRVAKGKLKKDWPAAAPLTTHWPTLRGLPYGLPPRTTLKPGLYCDISISTSINISITNVHTCCISTRKVAYASTMSSRMKPLEYGTRHFFTASLCNFIGACAGYFFTLSFPLITAVFISEICEEYLGFISCERAI